ncbi:MAG: class I cytochrome c [Rubrivivax sp.]|nr:class I cytochrome c [Rubrivivax sp.]
MKAALIAPLAACVALALGAATSSPAYANEALAKDKCGKCHEMEKKKKGPPYKETAAKFRGKADAEATMFKLATDPKGDHPEFTASPDDTKAVIKWILTLK